MSGAPAAFGDGNRRVGVVKLTGAVPVPPVPPGWQEQQLPPGLPLTETIESFRGPWNKSGSYGQTHDFSYPPSLSASEPVTIFNNDGISGPPRARTLHMFRSDVLLANGGNAELYARVTYGVGGIQNQFFCDWVRGGQISLVCQTLRVDAVAYQPLASLAYSAPAGTEQLGVMLGHQGTPPPLPPTFTTQRVARNVSAIDELSFAVPDFARWAYPNQVPLDTGGAQNTTSRMIFRNNGAGRLRELLISEALLRDGSVIPGGTTKVNFLNPGPANESFSVTFALGL